MKTCCETRNSNVGIIHPCQLPCQDPGIDGLFRKDWSSVALRDVIDAKLITTNLLAKGIESFECT